MSNASQHLDGGFTGGVLSPRHAAEAPLLVVHAVNLQAVIAVPPAAATSPIAMLDLMYGPLGGFAADGLPPGFSPQPVSDGLPPGFSPPPSFGALPGGPAAEGLPTSCVVPAATAYYGGFARVHARTHGRRARPRRSQAARTRPSRPCSTARSPRRTSAARRARCCARSRTTRRCLATGQARACTRGCPAREGTAARHSAGGYGRVHEHAQRAHAHSRVPSEHMRTQA
jgi:hypothetical protein